LRYGLLSDVHGNLPALEAALAVLATEEVDAYLCAGDLVGYGPSPNECVEMVLSLPGVCVAGNHDLIAVGALPPDRCSVAARRSLVWTVDALGEASRTALAALPRVAATSEGVVVAHGSVADPEEYVTRPSQAAAELRRALALFPHVRVLVLGHTHHALAVDDSGSPLPVEPKRSLELSLDRRHVVNPGSVGQSRETALHARVAVLDVGTGVLRFHAFRYDHRAVQVALAHHGLPPSAMHVPPRPMWRRLAGRLWRTAGRRKRTSAG